MEKINEITRSHNTDFPEWKGQTVNGKEVYIDYKCGFINVILDNNIYYSKRFGNEGELTYEELKKETKDILQLPKEEKLEVNELFPETDRIAEMRVKINKAITVIDDIKVKCKDNKIRFQLMIATNYLEDCLQN